MPSDKDFSNFRHLHLPFRFILAAVKKMQFSQNLHSVKECPVWLQQCPNEYTNILIKYLHKNIFTFYYVSEKNTKKLIFCDFLFLPILNKKIIKIELFQKVKSRTKTDLNGTTSRNDLFGKKAFFLQLLCKNEK